MSVDLETKIKKLIDFNFPDLDEEVSEYIYNVLNEGKDDDFTSSEDIYNCLGELFANIIPNGTNEIVNQLCKTFFNSLTIKNSNENKVNKKLDVPVYLGDAFSTQDKAFKDYKSIWCNTKEYQSQVDKKKLIKAEAKCKLKYEKRDGSNKPSNASSSWQKEAITSQMINKSSVKVENRSKDIKIENFDISFGDKCLLKNADLSLNNGRRYGLVGRNGIGKSTLLKMISNGSLVIPKHINLLHVEQEVAGDDKTVLECVLESDEIRTNLLKEEKSLLNKNDEISVSRLQQVYDELQAIDADKAPSRANKILFGLGFNSEAQERCTKTYSGGWRMRIALARALFSKPDLLLLDEPTNMLDMKAVIWLENYLVNSWKSILIVVSHDRSFLNKLATDILHFNNQKIDVYKGDYDTFEKARTEKLKNQEKEYEAQVMFRKHVQEFIDKFRYNAKRASLVQSKIKMLEKLPPLVSIKKESQVVFKFSDVEPLAGGAVIQLEEVYFKYETSPSNILENISLNVHSKSRICIVGDNGSGKTTLLKLLNGFLEPIKGLRNTHRNLKIGYFSQHHVDNLNLDKNSIEFLAEKFPGHNNEYYRASLGRFGISGDLGINPIASLSGGQKSRVVFAMISLISPNLLILDEPTNHLDIETVLALSNAINTFNGSVVLVSHDQQLQKMVCEELWLVKDKTVNVIKGGFEEYYKVVQSELQDLY